MTEVPSSAMVELARANLLVMVIRETLAMLPTHVQEHVETALHRAVAQEGVTNLKMQEATRIAAQGLRFELFERLNVEA